MLTPLTLEDPPRPPRFCALCGLCGRFLWPLVRHEQEGGTPVWAHRQCLADALAFGQTRALPEDPRTTPDDWLEYLPEHIDPVDAARKMDERGNVFHGRVCPNCAALEAEVARLTQELGEMQVQAQKWADGWLDATQKRDAKADQLRELAAEIRPIFGMNTLDLGGILCGACGQYQQWLMGKAIKRVLQLLRRVDAEAAKGTTHAETD